MAARFATLAQAANRVAQEARSLAASASASAGITAQALANRIEQPMRDVLGGDISLAMAVATPDSVIAVPADRVEQALIALAVNRGAAMRSGQIVLEIADVSVDQDAAKGRGGMSLATTRWWRCTSPAKARRTDCPATCSNRATRRAGSSAQTRAWRRARSDARDRRHVLARA